LSAGPAAPTPAVRFAPSPEVVRSFTATVETRAAPPRAQAIDLVDAEHGWIGTADGIVATADAGATWRRQHTGSIDVVALDIVDRLAGWALGKDDLLGTTDGGASWVSLGMPRPALRSIEFIDASAGWGVAGGEVLLGTRGSIPNRGGILVRTDDGGRSWREDRRVADAQQVCFTSATHGWVTSPRSVLRTIDAGRSWRTVLVPPLVEGPTWVTEIGCAAADVAWVQFHAGGAGGTGYQVLQRTDDGGERWDVLKATGPTLPLRGGVGVPSPLGGAPGSYPGPFSVVDAQAAFFAGGDAALDWLGRTRDGGRSWSQVLRGRPLAVDFVDAERGWALLYTPPGTRVISTSDGGRTWQRRYPDDRAVPAFGVSFVSPAEGFGIGLPEDRDAVLKSEDGGATWRRIGALPAPPHANNAFAARSVSFVDRTTGWAVDAFGRLQRTGDGGRTWREVDVTAGTGRRDPLWATSVGFSSASTGWVVAGTTVFVTADGGRTWHPLDPPLDAHRLMACTAGGLCWIGRLVAGQHPIRPAMLELVQARADGRGPRVTIDLLHDVAVSGAVRAVSVRDAGAGSILASRGCGDLGGSCLFVLDTNDGGRSWVENRIGIRGGDISVLDASFAWIWTGDALFRTSDGGRSWRQVS
ncbi:MAG: hypothetical protein ACRDF0_09065, partial [Candidatus Limnocylindria bacterium]